MLLPFNGLPRTEDEDVDHKRQNEKQVPTPEISEPTYKYSCSDR